MKTFTSQTALSAIVLALAAPQSSSAIFTIRDLGAFEPGSDSRAAAINASGQIVGSATTSNHRDRAFRTAPGGNIADPDSNLGPLVLNSIYADHSYANGINASGQTVGAAFTWDGAHTHAFRTTPTGKVADLGADLGTLGGYDSEAFAINSAGQVIGYAYTAALVKHAFRTSATGLISDAGTDLGTLGGTNSSAFGINDSGQVVGRADLPGDSAYHAFRTTPTGRVSDLGTDLGTLGGPNSEAFAINASGRVVGWSTLASLNRHAFRTTATGLVSDPGADLGTLGGFQSAATAINSAGQTVGWSYSSGFSNQRAFFVDATGTMADLNDLIPADSGWILTSATGINDSGQIVGTGYPPGFFDGRTHAFLLTPIPEPNAFIPLATTFILLIRRRKLSGSRTARNCSLFGRHSPCLQIPQRVGCAFSTPRIP